MGEVFLLKVLDYKDKMISGKLFDVERNKHYDYDNLSQILMLISGILGENRAEDMQKDAVYTSASKEGYFEMVSGEKSWLLNKLRVFRTFKLSICFTNFNTWQGELWCVDTGSHNAFRSVLELMLLLNAELESAAAGGESIAAEVGA
ncbi:MAG: hypothetical protein K5767_02360 [Clostridia bacterium]|nr:hypothetical protein [Clostridia bacterium]